MNRTLYLSLLALGLVAACSTVSWTSTVKDRSDELRSAMTRAIPDPARRAELLQRVDAMQAVLLDTIQASGDLHREFVEASVEPSATEDQLRSLAGKIAKNRRDGMHRFLSARIELRRQMTPAEWADFAGALPAFDGGPQ